MRDKLNEELDNLNSMLITMGDHCEEAISYAVKALNENSDEIRTLTFETDKIIDDMEREIEGICYNLLLRQQPVAKDLRLVSAALKMISDMERIGDQAYDIAEITKTMKRWQQIDMLRYHRQDVSHIDRYGYEKCGLFRKKGYGDSRESHRHGRYRGRPVHRSEGCPHKCSRREQRPGRVFCGHTHDSKVPGKDKRSCCEYSGVGDLLDNRETCKRA